MRLAGEIVVDVLTYCQKQFAFGLMPSQQITIQPLLPQGIFQVINSQVINSRSAEKAFDLDGNLPRTFLSSNQSFRAKIYLNRCLAPRKRERIVRNCPPISFKRLPDVFVIDVLCSHNVNYALALWLHQQTEFADARTGSSFRDSQADFAGRHFLPAQ